MILRPFDALSTDERKQLSAFEKEFDYPLGETGRFRISHGHDYGRFFRSMGDSCVFVAQDKNRFLGTLGIALRNVQTPSGSQERVAYIGDLKIASAERGRWVLVELAKAALLWAKGKTRKAFSVVMGGTSSLPGAYTGRLSIPMFREISRLSILRWSLHEDTDASLAARADLDGVSAAFARLSLNRFSVSSGDAALRSEHSPQGWVLPDGSACGCLEDTRQTKQLWSLSGEEIRSAHLSSFAYASLESGVRLLRAVMKAAAQNSYPALFTALPERDASLVASCFPKKSLTVAPAFVFGTGLPNGYDWSIHSSEV